MISFQTEYTATTTVTKEPLIASSEFFHFNSFHSVVVQWLTLLLGTMRGTI